MVTFLDLCLVVVFFLHKLFVDLHGHHLRLENLVLLDEFAECQRQCHVLLFVVYDNLCHNAIFILMFLLLDWGITTFVDFRLQSSLFFAWDVIPLYRYIAIPQLW